MQNHMLLDHFLSQQFQSFLPHAKACHPGDQTRTTGRPEFPGPKSQLRTASNNFFKDRSFANSGGSNQQHTASDQARQRIAELLHGFFAIVGLRLRQARDQVTDLR